MVRGRGSHTRARHSMAVSPCGWLAALGTGGGGQKSRAAPGVQPLSLPLADFISVPCNFWTAGKRWHRQGGREGQPGGWSLRPPKRCAVSPPRPCPPDLSDTANWVCHHAQRGVFRRIISPFYGRLPGRMSYKGTMGTWEQAMSDRQKAAPLKCASLFPRHRTDLGTWEQKWPIPMQENPRACGYPLPPPAGERD